MKKSNETTRRFERPSTGAVVIAMGACIVASLLAADPAEAQSADVVQQAAARHEQGIQHFQAARYREAAGEFRAAEGLAHDRANLRNLARCHQELGEHDQALTYVDRYLEEPGLPADARARALELRATLVASRSGGTTSDGPSLVGPWVLLGSGLALLLTGGVLDIVAFTGSTTENDGTDPFASHPEYQDWRESARSLALAGDILVGVGAAATVAGLVWLLVARSRRSPTATSARRLSLAATPGQGAFGASLRF